MTDKRFRKEEHHGRVVTCHGDRPTDIFAMFLDTVARAPDAVALVDGDIRWTYATLARRAGQCAARLAALGLVAGDRLGILLDNRADYTTLLLASARLGLIAVPMNIRQKPPETAHALTDSGAVALVYENILADQLPNRGALPDLRLWLPYSTEAALWDRQPVMAADGPQRSAVTEDDPFCILYTSGTTGRPKGAVLTHFGVVTSCLGSRDHLHLRDGEAMVLSVPASHVTGIVLVLMLALCVAGKLVVQRGFKAKQFLEFAQAEGVTYAIMVPAMYKLCLMDEDYAAFDLSRWRIGAYGGAPMAEATIEKLARETPQLTLVNIYGSTETTSPAVMMPLGEGPSRRDQVGRALPYADIVIMDADGRQCPAGQQGEIWIAGPMTVPRYWNNADASATNFTGGYWKSGDIGVMDADGYIRLLDRMKDVINRGGFKIYSVEVENVLMAHDAVAEAVVVGRPCPVLGERVEAFVVAHEAVRDDALRQFCADRLSDYKIPDHVYIVDGPLPRNANGKLLKNVVREWLPPVAAQ
ncbi:acyl-CoA synthetase (AMP-forming)/AMP-acid ligase II [Sphingobium sp. OAS761]|uniref:class I adenylate-forming enzyme family protein n=1 Tax=Sphingobium sp. OAS761 TaxID=2817901 RepID=UPI0020A06866|nr:class I adenylate-forming enzyme family protein [Sphingobium sp. OAS761]MCP1470284.1 acyl-CoA synthetase (AMP-forming)/AMP-acid ligase II [Sphingobium sp. OAS761]